MAGEWDREKFLAGVRAYRPSELRGLGLKWSSYRWQPWRGRRLPRAVTRYLAKQRRRAPQIAKGERS